MPMPNSPWLQGGAPGTDGITQRATPSRHQASSNCRPDQEPGTLLRDLHDEIIQSIYAIGIGLRTAWDKSPGTIPARTA